MPARPMILDEIDKRMKGVLVVDLIVPLCCVASCRKASEALLSCRYSDGRVDVYGLCKGHLKEMQLRHPSRLERTGTQGIFYYAGF